MCLAAPSTYNGILVLTAFVGIGVGGNIPIDTTICLEFIPQVRHDGARNEPLTNFEIESTVSPGFAVDLPTPRRCHSVCDSLWIHT